MKPSLLHSICRLGISCSAIFTALTAAAQSAPPPPVPETDALVQLSPFDVVGTPDRGYGAAYSMGSTRIALPVSDVSTSVVTVDSQLLQDTGAVELQEAMKYVSGVTNTSAAENGRISVRGYDAMGSLVRDGLPSSAFIDSVNPLDMAQYDRVEVIKGPNGLLYGASSLGGLVNRVTKQPLAVPFTELTGTFESYDSSSYRVSLDTTGPIDEQHRLLYRVIVTRDQGDTNVSQGGEDRQKHSFTAINPQFEYRITPQSRIRFWLAYTQENLPRNPYTYGDSHNLPDTFWGTSYGFELNDVFERVQSWEYELAYTNAFKILDSDWALNLVARDYEGKNQWLLDTPLGNVTVYNAAGTALGLIQNVPNGAGITKATAANFFRRWWDDSADNWLANLDLTGKFDTGPVRHVMFTGIQELAANNLIRQYQSLGASPAAGYEIWPTLQVPDLGSPQSIGGQISNATAYTKTFSGNEFDWAIQDSAYLFKDRLILVAGARYDRGEPGYTQNILLNTFTPSVPFQQWTPKYGVIIKPLPGVSLFYNQTSTFQVNSGIDTRKASPTFDQRFPNSVGNTKEAGIKLQLFDNRVIATASYFDTRLTNVLVSVIDDDAGTVTGTVRGTYLLPAGSAVDRGMEFDTSAEITKDLDVIAAYSTLVARTNLGIRQRNAPGRTASLFARYSLHEGFAKGIAFGAGVQHTGSRSWDAADTASLAAYTTYDAFVSYALNAHWHFQLNVDNVFDKVYLEGSTNRNAIFWGEPRTFQLRFRYTL